MKNFSLSILFLCIGFSLFAQENQKLLTLENEPVYVKEFQRLFSKNANLISAEKQGSLEDNLNLFIDYKLKVLEAENQGLDTLPSFIKQYNAYKKHLSDSYLFDTKVNQQMLEEAYQRIKHERKVNYILVKSAKDASPEDTLKAYQKAKEFKIKLEDGGNFEELALAYSEDPSVKENKGNLGWINAFKTVYPFENAVYETPIGGISEPFRSQFGYHVVEVVEERKSDGKILTAHLLITPKSDATEDQEEAKEKIDNIYQQIIEGAAFADMAKQYSDDKATAKRGGKMNAFGRGSLKSKTFEDEAFQLSAENPISKPFKTSSGWHIIQFIKHFPIGDFEKEKNSLREEIKRNHRSQIIKDSLIKKLSAQYTVKIHEPGLDYFKEKTGDDFLKNAKENLPEGNIFSIAEQGYTFEYFYNKLRVLEQYRGQKITAEFLEVFFNEEKDNFLINYKREKLAEENEVYANELEDYKNGILVYEVINKNVLEKSQDSTKLKEFYTSHKSDFVSPEKYEVLLVSSADKKEVSKARRLLKRGKPVKDLNDISADLLINSGEFEKEDPQLPKNFKKKPGISAVIQQNGVYLVGQTIRVIPAQEKDFEAVKGKVLNRYQEKLEHDFMHNLRNKYKVERNEKALKALKN